MGRNRKYSDKEMLDSMREFENEVEKYGSVRRYIKWREKGKPTSFAIIQRFGGWGKARIKAGFSYTPPKTYTDEELIECLREAIDALGERVTTTRYEEWAGDKPSYKTISSRLGGWKNAKEKALGREVSELHQFCRDCLEENCTIDIESCEYWQECV